MHARLQHQEPPKPARRLVGGEETVFIRVCVPGSEIAEGGGEEGGGVEGGEVEDCGGGGRVSGRGRGRGKRRRDVRSMMGMWMRKKRR